MHLNAVGRSGDLAGKATSKVQYLLCSSHLWRHPSRTNIGPGGETSGSTP